jgi:hypothetical protein
MKWSSAFRIAGAGLLLLFAVLFAGCGGGGGGGDVDEDTQPDQWGEPGAGANGIPIFWTRLGGNAYSGAASIVETADHGFVVAGFRQADGANASAGSVVKFKSGGTIAWEREFNDPGYSIVLNCIRKTSDGGFVAAGQHRSSTDTSDPGTFLVIRMDASGHALEGWPKTYEMTCSGGATSICESRDGSGNPDGFVFTGAVLNGDANDIISFIEKIDLNGGFLWKRAYAPLMFGTDAALTVTQDDNQGFIVAGAEGNEILYGYNDLSDRMWVDRIGANGASLAGWPRYYDSGAVSSVKKTSDGGFVLAGNSFSRSGSKYNDAKVVKVGADGEAEWTMTFGGLTTTDNGADIDLCADGGYIIAGGTESYDPSGSNPKAEVLLIRLDASGKAIWKKVKGRTSSHEVASGVVAASDGGFAISGGASGSLMMAKFDSTGKTINLGQDDYTLNVTDTMGTINQMNATALMGRGINAVSQSVLIGAFGLDTLVAVRDDPTLNGRNGLTVSPAPTSIPAGGPYTITMTGYSTRYGGADISITGAMTVLITTPGTITEDGTYTAEATVSDVDLSVTDSEDLTTSFAGDFAFYRENTATYKVERASVSTGKTLSITGDGATLTMSGFWNMTHRNLTSGLYTISTGNTMVFQVTGTTGNLELYVPSIIGTNPMAPSSGDAEIMAEDDSTVKIHITSGGNVKLDVDTDGDGTTDNTSSIEYEDLF